MVRTPVRMLAIALVAVLCTGCNVANVWNDVPVGDSSATSARTTATVEPSVEPDDRTLRPYTGALAARATCRRATTDELAELEEFGGVGGTVTYPVGVLVKANAPWWTAAVRTRVAEGHSSEGVDRYAFFVTSYPTYGENFDHEPFAWQLSSTSGDQAAAMALACVKKLPLPKDKVDPNDPASYTGKLASGARCTPLSASLLGRMEQVGQVGGAITYPRGQMVRANGKWWTVAVATQVHANSQGYTSQNVPATELFVTNAPSSASKSTTIVSFPITARKTDTAARKALACLEG